MIRRPPRSTLDRSSAASDVYKRQDYAYVKLFKGNNMITGTQTDGDGNYVITNIDNGTYDVEASYLGSVSYTHLRAHETVLDLVCRLLLDKKNSQISYPLVSTTYNIHTSI